MLDAVNNVHYFLIYDPAVLSVRPPPGMFRVLFIEPDGDEDEFLIVGPEYPKLSVAKLEASRKMAEDRGRYVRVIVFDDQGETLYTTDETEH